MLTHWIGCKSVPSRSHEEIPVLNPATETLLDSIPRGCDDDVHTAVDAATAALQSWAARSPSKRLADLTRIAARMDEHCEDIARQLTLENGKPYRLALQEVRRAARTAASYAELSVHLRGGSQMAPSEELVFHHRVPRGVAACIMPWNYPLGLSFSSFMACLAGGNTVIWKPSEKTPLSARMLGELVFDHMPPGVFNILLGDGKNVGEPLVRARKVDVVVFIGSVATGTVIAEICAAQMKKCVLELGGKDALIIDDTVDLDASVNFAAESTFANSGQVCTSSERIYVHSAIFERFVTKLSEKAQSLKVGEGLEPDTDIGPLMDALQLERVMSHVEEAVQAGAVVHQGGKRLNRPGYFFQPTVMTDVPHTARLLREETFGPVSPVEPFTDFDEALARANDSSYGLGVILCTTAAPHAIRAIHGARTGMVKINTKRGKAPGSSSEPSGNSGLGNGYGAELFNEVTRLKSVHWRARLPPDTDWS